MTLWKHTNVGRVVQVIGNVVDIEFASGQLPAIYNAVQVVDEKELSTEKLEVTVEVQQHLGENRVRTVAMQPTDGLVRGMKALDTGQPITVPVGRATLGRVLNVLGEPVDKLGEVIEAADGFLLVVSYNPGYQNAMKDLKHSTRQRFVALEFDFPDEERETQIIAHESGVDEDNAALLARLGAKIRNLREHGLEEGASTRVLIYAGRLIKEGISARRACQVGVTWGITDDPQIQRSIDEVVSSIFP